MTETELPLRSVTARGDPSLEKVFDKLLVSRNPVLWREAQLLENVTSLSVQVLKVNDLVCVLPCNIMCIKFRYACLGRQQEKSPRFFMFMKV
jgi:hypothetical protein